MVVKVKPKRVVDQGPQKSHFLRSRGQGGGLVLAVVVVLVEGEARVLPDGGALEVEDVRDETAGEGEEGQQRARPLVPEGVVHLLGEEDDAGAPEAADAGLCGEGAGGLVLVRVDEVVVGRVVEEDEAEADGEAAHHGAPVRQGRVRGPREDEQPDGHEPAREHHRDEARFGGWFAVGRACADRKIVSVDQRAEDGRAHDAQRQGDEHEARHAFGPAFALHVHDRVRHEEHVQKAVEDRHVQADQQDDGFQEEQLERSNEEDPQLFAERSRVEFLLRHVSGVARFLAEFLRSTGEEDRRVRLGDREGQEEPTHRGQDELDPVQPSPTGSVTQEATRQGADGGTDEGSSREHGHGNTSLFVSPQVSERATHKGHGSGEGDAVNESTDQKRADVVSYRTGDFEDNRQCDGDDIDRFAAIEL